MSLQVVNNRLCPSAYAKLIGLEAFTEPQFEDVAKSVAWASTQVDLGIRSIFRSVEAFLQPPLEGPRITRPTKAQSTQRESSSQQSAESRLLNGDRLHADYYPIATDKAFCELELRPSLVGLGVQEIGQKEDPDPLPVNEAGPPLAKESLIFKDEERPANCHDRHHEQETPHRHECARLDNAPATNQNRMQALTPSAKLSSKALKTAVERRKRRSEKEGPGVSESPSEKRSGARDTAWMQIRQSQQKAAAQKWEESVHLGKEREARRSILLLRRQL